MAVFTIGDALLFRAAETIDCTGLHVLPGVIDSQVHLREPGAEHKEDLETGGRAAVLGGVTGVFEMPNTKPLTVTAEALADKIRRATGRMHCDFAFYIGGTRDNGTACLERLPGCAGIKVFMGSSTGDLLVEDDAASTPFCRTPPPRRLPQRRRICVCARASHQPPAMPRATPSGVMPRPRACAPSACCAGAQHGKRIHVLHISTADELPLLAANRDIATVEVTPHHLTLRSDDYAASAPSCR